MLYKYKYLETIILHEYTERFPLYNIYAIHDFKGDNNSLIIFQVILVSPKYPNIHEPE